MTFFELWLELGDHGVHGQVDAALQVHRIGAGGHGLGAFLDDGLGQHGRCRGAVAGDVGGLGRDLLQHLRAHVLELVLELDLLGDGDAVLGDARGAEGFLDDDVASLGAERDLDGIGEDVDAAQHLLAGVGVEFHFFGRHCQFPSDCVDERRRLRSRRKGAVASSPSASTAAIAPTRRVVGCSERFRLVRRSFDDTHDVVFLHDQQVFAVDLDLGAGPFAEQDLVALLDVERRPACRSRRACPGRPRGPRLAVASPWPCRE